MTGWGGAANGFEAGAGANKAGLVPNDGANELEPNIASPVVAFEPNVCAVELVPNSGSSEVELLLNAVWELVLAPNVACDAATENKSPLSGDECRLPVALTLADSWSGGRVGDVNVDDDLAAGSLELLDVAGELDAICFSLCCWTHANHTARF